MFKRLFNISVICFISCITLMCFSLFAGNFDPVSNFKTNLFYIPMIMMFVFFILMIVFSVLEFCYKKKDKTPKE